MFINLSNHPSSFWQSKQLEEAKKYGEIIDIPFPIISANATSQEIDALVEQFFSKVMKFDNPTVMLQGEFIFTFRLTTKLKKERIRVLSSRTERKTVEEIDSKGRTIKKSIFEFIEFMEY